MRHNVRRLSVMLVASFAAAVPARAEVTGSVNGSATGLPIPRYVSLKADKVNMHIGPGKQYETKWVYQRAGLPVEITAEFENWRRIRDSDGTEGWVYHSLLSGRRTGVVIAKSQDDLIAVHEEADVKSDIAARLQPGVLAAVKRCDTTWCRVIGRGFEGWIPQERLWGVYPNEQVD